MPDPKLGPNVLKLITRKMSVDAIPGGGGLQDGVEFMQDPTRTSNAFREAQDWAIDLIAALRRAHYNEELGSDDDVAKEILHGIERLER